MWWLDPGKEVLNVLFNRVLAPYVENLDMNQVNYGIGQGQVTLRNLQLKKGALDKFRLPVDVVEGHLGKFTLSLHWMNLGNQPVEVLIEDVYLLVVPSPEGNQDPEEEERRAQAAKAERLENAELLHMRGQPEQAQDSPQSQGLLSSLITKIVNNLQVTVKNIHVRYEDKLSVPEHPFAAGVTLAGFTAISVNAEWQPAFIDSTAGVIHKLTKLHSLALYFDTDTRSLAGLSHAQFVEKFSELIAKDNQYPQHQFVLKPVSGEGRIKINHKLDRETPRFDVQLLFDEIGVLLDDDQYRDAISLVDMFHFYTRQHKYQKYRPPAWQLEQNRPRALLRFAADAILDEVRERRRKWTWAYLAERRDDRHRYVDLFKKKQLSPLSGPDLEAFEAMEKKLSYEDIRFYRSIARSQLKKGLASRKKIEEEKKKQQAQTQSSWTGWLWGSTEDTSTKPEETAFSGELSEEQRRQLYEVLDYDEKAALAESFEAPRDALQTRVVAKLRQGTFALKTDPHGANTEILSMVSNVFQATFIQRPDNFETSLSLGSFAVHDGTTKDSVYPLIVHVQESRSHPATPPADKGLEIIDTSDPFFFLQFEKNPLDGRADSALTVRLRYMEIVYHRGYVEAIYRFFKPPSSQLESVEALLDVASQTLEGLRKETRAGLEYALQTHKTIDVQMDLNAPIIIVPEDITSKNCKHLVIDAGHIAVESQLADKKAIQDINSKRKQQYSEQDYQQLESMMYDRMSVRLQDAQFLIGSGLESCREALASKSHDSLHLLERINIDLQVQNSIVPTAYNLARFKVSGHLPTLQFNISDTKYKFLMRLIDVSIPHFDEDSDQVPSRPLGGQVTGTWLQGGFFGSSGDEYHVEDNEDQEASASSEDGDAAFYEAEASGNESPEIHQRVFELHFRVDTLRASVYKSAGDGSEKELGNIAFQQFSLAFAMEKYSMNVDINLRSLSMDIVHPTKGLVPFISSADTNISEDLLTVRYRRVQPESPEFSTVYEGINQSVDIEVTTFIFRTAPEPVVSLYDFIMTTFVPQRNEVVTARESVPSKDQSGDVQQAVANAQEKIRVLVKLASIQLVLINDDVQLATLSMSTANVSVLLRANTMRINARLGSLALTDDSPIHTALPAFKHMLSIDGDNFAELEYQTHDPADKETYRGIKSSVILTAGSLRVHYLERPLQAIYVFMVKLAKLKGLYDAATEAAVQRASEIERMQFKISIKSPIVVFPSDPEKSSDILTLRLGELNAENAYEEAIDRIHASLRGIQLSSQFDHEGRQCILKMIDDINADAEVIQASDIDHKKELERPDTQVAVTVSDVRLHLTQIQYCVLFSLLQSIPRVFQGASEDLIQIPEPSPSQQMGQSVESDTNSKEGLDLLPEIRNLPNTDAKRVWNTVDFVVILPAVKLHLYDDLATAESSLKEHGIARFALNSSTLRGKALSDGAMEYEIVLKSFTMTNTRPGFSKFREIIPAAQHDRNQFMALYSVSGGSHRTAMAVLTIDSPQIIFAVEPVIALLEFFMSAFNSDAAKVDASEGSQAHNDTSGHQQASPPINLRLELHDVSISVLENDADADSQAIQLHIKQFALSQQGILALSVSRLGMSLTRMGKASESVRFLDDTELTLSLDSRSTTSQQTTSIEVSAKPIVLRASYRDINLITTIVNRAIELYGRSTESQSHKGTSPSLARPARTISTRRKSSKSTSFGMSKFRSARSQPVGHANVLMTKEQLHASFDGFRLVLIGDLHEQPLLHFRVKPFVLTAKDWSGELQATTTLAIHLGYWNLTNSRWEPLLDPWTFTASVGRDSPSGGISTTISARERLDLNISTTFVEMAIATSKMIGRGEQVLRGARGSYAPYRIRNRTGYPVYVWADTDGSADTSDAQSTQIANEKTIDWRFDDWKTTREHVSAAAHNSIGLKFAGKQWEQLRSIPVDREGEYTYTLRPRTEKYPHRILVEVKVQDNVKLVTLRSTYKVENRTFYVLEVTLVNDAGQPVYSLERIAPGQDYSLPIEAVTQTRIRIQPDQGFGYKWSPPIRWEDLLTRRGFTVRCPHSDPKEAAFRFQAWVDTDVGETDARKQPKIALKLRAPIELENLLPYNIDYRIYDKNTDQNWKSYLRQGGVMPVHSVEIEHLVLLNVHVQDTTFKPSDFAIINTDVNADFEIEKKLTLRDVKDRKLDLKLHYERYLDSGGAFKVQVYCPYLVLNKTGQSFGVRPARAARIGSMQDVAGDTRPDSLSQPTPFMISHPNDQGKEFCFQVADSMWSQVVSMEAPTAETRLVMPSQTRKGEEVHIGLSWSQGLGKYKLTKVITLTPRFIIRNNTSEAINFREHGVAPRGRATLNPGERSPLYFFRVGEDKLLTVAFPGLNAQWSAPINLEDIGTTHFRLKTSGELSQMHIMRADVKLGGPTIFVVISRAVEGWPFTIENESDYPFTFFQTDLDHPDPTASGKSLPTYTLPPKSSVNYAWDYPAGREKKLVLSVNSARRVVDIMEIGDLMPFKFTDRQGVRAVSLDVRAEGHKQVLRITNYVPELSLYKPKQRISGSLARQDTVSSSQEAFEAVQEEAASLFAFNLDLDGIGISLINRKMTEVVYISIKALKFEYSDSIFAQAVNLTCGNMQVDNQLHDALFPVVLQPMPIPKDSGNVASLPTVQGSVIWLKDREHGVLFVKYCSVLLQALTIEADEDFLYAILDLTKVRGASWDERQEDILIPEPQGIVEPEGTAGGEDVYFEVLELQPIKLSISFMRMERVSVDDEKLSVRNPLAVIINAILMAIGNINEAPLEMNALAIKDMRLSLPDLQERIIYHYRQEVLRQLYRILGSADFIGNPVGLFTNVSSGVADIFYEPFNGAVMHGNRELGIGIAKGAASFVKKTVFGFSDSVTKFTSSVGKGLSAATFDSEYQTRRRMTQRRNRPRHAIYGVTAGAEAFASSIVSGVEGVVMKPIEGAEAEGAKGFFKGFGKGIVGAVTKPVIGVFDLASNLSEGIRNTTTVFDKPARDRARLPRHIPADGVLVPYSEREAMGQYWMKDLENGAFRREQYAAHINLPGGDNVVLLTTTRVLSFWSNRLQLDWELPFTQVQGVTIEDAGIRFAHKGGREHDKFVFIPDKASQAWFFSQVASVVKAFNARRRMDP